MRTVRRHRCTCCTLEGLESIIILFPEPKDPPKNVVISIIPEEVTRLRVTFTPPEEPNGNITAYFVYVFEKDQLVKNVSLSITERGGSTITGVIEGLKGGRSYSIQVDRPSPRPPLSCLRPCSFFIPS